MPEPLSILYPTILDRVEAPILRVYAAEVVIAEKLHAMVVLDIRNSRMKDFYDIWFLARAQSFDFTALATAIRSTFGTASHAGARRIALALTTTFLEDAGKIQQWAGFIRRLQLAPETPSLAGVGQEVAEFVRPLFVGARALRR
jgi:predicted nucleotidyltransferase component of viral defense system